MALPLRAKINVGSAALYCFAISFGLLYNPKLVAEFPVVRAVSRWTGLPTAVVDPAASDAYAFAAYGVFIVGASYTMAVWNENVEFLKSLVFVRIAVGLFGLFEVFGRGVGGATVFCASVADLVMALTLRASLASGKSGKAAKRV